MNRPTAGHPSVVESAPSPLNLWAFLWGAGNRRLHLSVGHPSPEDQIVESLPELLAAASRQRARDVLGALLDGGLLERWLGEALGETALAVATRQIRLDDRGLKLARWLQRAGAKLWFVAGEPIDTLDDLARLPLRVRDLTDLWEQIWQRVPQERFVGDPRAVRILDEARGETALPGEARALIACLRLGLEKLPVACDDGLYVLERPEQLAALLDRPGARDRLAWLLSQRVLERWIERVRPSAVGEVIEALGLPPEIAFDRVARALDPDGLHLGPGLRARGFIDLARLAGENPSVLCGAPHSRDRIRDALFHAPPIAGTPIGVSDFSELELAEWPEQVRARLFAWVVLRVPLTVAGYAIATRGALLEALADRTLRARLCELAESGMLSLYSRRVLGIELGETLAGRVAAADFPSLCVALGDPPPILDVSFPAGRLALWEGGEAEVMLRLINRDETRTAILDLSTVVAPPSAVARVAARIVLAPGQSQETPLQCRSIAGRSGRLTVEARVTGAQLALPARLEVRVHFAFRALLGTALGWALALAPVALMARWALSPLLRTALDLSSLGAWAAGGVAVGAAYGLALGLRAASRPALGELLRALVLFLGAAATLALGR